MYKYSHATVSNTDFGNNSVKGMIKKILILDKIIIVLLTV